MEISRLRVAVAALFVTLAAGSAGAQVQVQGEVFVGTTPVQTQPPVMVPQTPPGYGAQVVVVPQYGQPQYGAPQVAPDYYYRWQMYEMSAKSVALAVVLDAIVPGVGNIYAGNFLNAAITWGAFAVGFTLMIQGFEDCAYDYETAPLRATGATGWSPPARSSSPAATSSGSSPPAWRRRATTRSCA
jgi:hypothetical protein